MATTASDTLIIGGGLAGIVTALELLRAPRSRGDRSGPAGAPSTAPRPEPAAARGT